MRRAGVAALLAAVAAGVWYLHDPAWLIDQTAGLRAEERAADGTLFRWSGGHASFFVPSNAGTIASPVATTFDARGASPMVVAVFVDDARAGGVVLTDEAWHSIAIRLPPPGSRRVRRIDIRTSVVREDNRGVKIGRVQANP
jgi:hypothetical protein